MPLDGTVSWPVHIQVPDISADKFNPSVDFGSAAFWFVVCKAQLKASGGANFFTLQASDALAGTGNINNIGGSYTSIGTQLASMIVTGWFSRSQQYLGIDLTIGTSATWDFDIWATQAK